MSTALDFDEACGAEGYRQGANGVAFAGTRRPAGRRQGTPIYMLQSCSTAAHLNKVTDVHALGTSRTPRSRSRAKLSLPGGGLNGPWSRACPIGSLRSLAAWSTRRHSPVVQDVLMELDAQCRTEQTCTGRFWVILTRRRRRAAAPSLVFGGDNGISSTADLRTGFGKIRATFAVTGFQEARGGMESPFEAARMALGEAPYNVFDHKNIGGSGVLKLRADARKFRMMLTDEDADGPIYPANWDWGFGVFDTGPTSWSSYDSGTRTSRRLSACWRRATSRSTCSPIRTRACRGASSAIRRAIGPTPTSPTSSASDDRLPGGRRPVAVARRRPAVARQVGAQL